MSKGSKSRVQDYEAYWNCPLWYKGPKRTMIIFDEFQKDKFPEISKAKDNILIDKNEPLLETKD